MTTLPEIAPGEVLIVAVAETAGAALYGMFDVLLAAGDIWQALVRTESESVPAGIHRRHLKMAVVGYRPFCLQPRTPRRRTDLPPNPMSPWPGGFDRSP
jgi:hypothetical protein